MTHINMSYRTKRSVDPCLPAGRRNPEMFEIILDSCPAPKMDGKAFSNPGLFMSIFGAGRE